MIPQIDPIAVVSNVFCLFVFPPNPHSQLPTISSDLLFSVKKKKRQKTDPVIYYLSSNVYRDTAKNKAWKDVAELSCASDECA